MLSVKEEMIENKFWKNKLKIPRTKKNFAKVEIRLWCIFCEF